MLDKSRTNFARGLRRMNAVRDDIQGSDEASLNTIALR
jgi:hypothetical protein